MYSSPEGLWTQQGELDEAALARGAQAAQVLRAPRLKMSVGGFSPSSHASLQRLKALLQAAPQVELVIENDRISVNITGPALVADYYATEQ